VDEGLDAAGVVVALVPGLEVAVGVTVMETVGEVEVVAVVGGVALAPAVPANTDAALGPTAPLSMRDWLKSWLVKPCRLPRALARALVSMKPGARILSARLSSINVKARESYIFGLPT
jgi:hypothetical protein